MLFKKLLLLVSSGGILATAGVGSAQVTDSVLMVNEIMYDPVGGDNTTNQEWVELFNNSNDSIDLAGYKVTAGTFPEFTFPAGATIAAKGYVIIVGGYPDDDLNLDVFVAKNDGGIDRSILYDFEGSTGSKLGNGGSTISLFAPGVATPFETVTYVPVTEANNLGRTLELNNPAADNSTMDNWQVSDFKMGSPGKYNSAALPIAISGAQRNIQFPGSADTVSVSANIDSSNTLATVQIFVDSGSGLAPIAMTDGGSGNYTASLGTFADDTLIEYYIKAVDSLGNEITYPDLAPRTLVGFHVDNTPVTSADVIINEVLWEPSGTDNATHSEYVEIYNRTAQTLDLSYFAWGPDLEYTYRRLVPKGTTIAPNAYLVLAARGQLFKDAFPTVDPSIVIDGMWSRSLSGLGNSSSDVVLAHANAFRWNDQPTLPLDIISYTAIAPWPVVVGKSIELSNPAVDNSVAANWAATTRLMGSPGEPNSAFNTNNLTITNVARAEQYPALNAPVIINATINGNSPPITAQVLVNTGTGFTPVAMTDNGGGSFSANIGPFASHAAITYAVKATDASGFFMTEPNMNLSRFVVDNPVGADDLVINEIMYNNLGSDNATYTEWIEFYNRRSAPINVSLFQVGRAVDHADTILLPVGTIIPANGYLIFAGQRDKFLEQYPGVNANIVVDGGWTNGSKLGNSASSPAIVHANAVKYPVAPSVPFDIVQFGTADPNGGTWPADTDGVSYQLNDPANDNSLAINWLSTLTAGSETPGASNVKSNVPDWSVY